MDMPTVLVPPEAGKLYYIPLSGLHPDTTWKELKAHVQRVCPVHYAVIYPRDNRTGEGVEGWVRVSGKKNFSLAVDHLQNEKLRGFKLSVSVDNLYKEIPVKMPERAFISTPNAPMWPGNYTKTPPTSAPDLYDNSFEHYTPSNQYGQLHNQQCWYTQSPPSFASISTASNSTTPSPRILCIRHLPGRSWSKSQNRVMIETNLPPDLKRLVVSYETLFLPIRNDKPEPTDTIFVEFTDHEAALQAKDHLNGKKIQQNEANSNSKRRRLLASLVERYPWCKDTPTTTSKDRQGSGEGGVSKNKGKEREPAIARGSFTKEKAPVIACGSSYVPAVREGFYHGGGWEEAAGQGHGGWEAEQTGVGYYDGGLDDGRGRP